jgi:hypothetical protein
MMLALSAPTSLSPCDFVPLGEERVGYLLSAALRPIVASRFPFVQPQRNRRRSLSGSLGFMLNVSHALLATLQQQLRGKDMTPLTRATGV